MLPLTLDSASTGQKRAMRSHHPAGRPVTGITRNPAFFNASMAPNGYMEVWSGLLLRAEDEAQLAFVLGHEIGHYRERHTLATLRAIRGRAGAAMVFSIIAAGAGVGIIGDIAAQELVAACLEQLEAA